MWWSRRDRELDKELRFHIESQVEENLQTGMAPAEARRQAILAFGGLAQIREECRELRALFWVGNDLGRCSVRRTHVAGESRVHNYGSGFDSTRYRRERGHLLPCCTPRSGSRCQYRGPASFSTSSGATAWRTTGAIRGCSIRSSAMPWCRPGRCSRAARLDHVDSA